MTIDEIERLLALAAQSDVSEVVVTVDGCTLRMRKGGRIAGAPASSAGTSVEPLAFIRAPAAGLFMAGHPERPRGQQDGRVTSAGEIVGFLRIGPCLRPVLAPGAGEIGPALVGDGVLAGYGMALFAFSPDAVRQSVP